MNHGDVIDQRQPEAGAARNRCVGLAAYEGVPDTRQFLFGDAGPGVFDRERAQATAGLHPYEDRSRAVLERIVDEVGRRQN